MRHHVVAGVNPKRAGETHIGVPVFASAAEAMAKAPYDAAVMFIPPALAKAAALDAIAAGVKLLVVLTEHIPAQDVMAMLLAATPRGHADRRTEHRRAGDAGRRLCRHHAGA